jgi:hypothetical protein
VPGGVVVEVRREERYWYPDDGGIVWVAGLHLVDPQSGRFLGRDAPELAERGLHVASVAGAGVFHVEALQGEGAEPGRPLALRRDRDSEHDPNAIAVDDAAGRQLGWVPRDLAARIAPDLDAGTPWSATVLRERRASPRDPRTGLTMLLARAPSLELREHC